MKVNELNARNLNVPMRRSRLTIAGDTKYCHSRKLNGLLIEFILESAQINFLRKILNV
jgi:hypothetical protein